MVTLSLHQAFEMATEVTTAETPRPLLLANGHNQPRTVATSLNYYDDPGDGSPPAPVIIGG